jgi:hypothetical protein
LLSIVLPMALVGGGSFAAAETVTRSVEVVAQVHGAGRTPEQARHEALQRARELAVAEVAGIRVSAQQLRLRSEADGAVRDLFSHLVHTSAEGRIVDEQVRFTTYLDGDVPVYRAALLAEVTLEQGARDPGFELALETRPDSRLLRDGEPLALRITASRECWVTVLSLEADGQVRRLFPNPLDRDHHVAAEIPLELPGPDRTFEIRAAATAGPSTREQILVVATLDPVTFEAQAPVDDDLVPGTDGSAGLTALNRWLLGIPVERRVEWLWDYEVVE